jgi:acetyl esterase/lipase
MLAVESLIERLAASVGSLRKLGAEARGAVDASAREPFALLRRRGGGASPSWQARLLNTFTRLTVKPLMKRGSVASMRATLERLDEQSRRFMPADVRTEPVSTAGYDGEWVRVAGQRARRVLLYFPGGGFVMSAQVQHRVMLSSICREAQARSFLVHYRLAPETPFPGGLENCIAAYHGLLEQGIRPRDITLGGDSAGGGLVLSTLLALRDEGTPLPACAFVLSPLGDLTYSGGSRRYNSCRDPMLPTHRASQMHELYVGEALPGDRYASPVLADFDGLPPMLGQVGSTEILLDDTVRAAAQAGKARVPFYLEIWQDMPHVFPIMGFLPESAVAIARIAEFVRTGRLGELPARYGRSTPAAPPRWPLAALAG